MSPSQIQNYKNKDSVEKDSSFEERYATDDSKGHYKYIHKQNGKWVVVQKGTGKVLSTHDSEADAIASFKAMMVNKHGSVVTAKTWPAKEDDSTPTPENPWYKYSLDGHPEKWEYAHDDPEEHDYGSTIGAPVELAPGLKINLPYKTGLGSYINVRHHPDKGLWEASVGEAGPYGKEMHTSFHTTREDAMSKAHDAWQTHFPRLFEMYDNPNEHLSSKTAGAWPSETDWEGHLHNLEELLAETQKGVGWHAAKDEKKEMKAHDKLAKDLQKVIDDIKKVMKFPPAK